MVGGVQVAKVSFQKNREDAEQEASIYVNEHKQSGWGVEQARQI